jgi:cation:H+ antiporter
MISVHILMAVVSAIVLWLSSGFIISGVERLSKDIKVSRFAVSFLLLGALTSIPEISIGINAIVQKTPGIFVGNLIGASFVILIFIIPLLATFNRGVRLNQHLQPKRLMEFLLIIIAPLLIVYDGSVHFYEAILLILLYAVFVHSIQAEESIRQHLVPSEIISSRRLHVIGRILIGAALIFLASRFMINEVIFFSELLHISPFMISLLILPIGSNLPELVIAVRSITQKKIDIAFGDYIGSAAANTVLLGVLTILNGSFILQTSDFATTSMIMLGGYALFFIFAKSKRTISPHEGMILMLVFLIFLLFQITEVITLSNL